MRKGNLWIIAAPSGAGKTSLVAQLTGLLADLVVSVSHTTREPRPGEMEGINYYFVSESEFLTLRERGVFLESAEVFGHHYGTSKELVLQSISEGKDVILEIDWQGARLVRERLPQSRSIFILPPSILALKTRLEKRKQDSPQVIEQRLKKAKAEMQHYPEFDYLIFNEDFEKAALDLKNIISAARLEKIPQKAAHEALITELLA